MPDDSRNDTDSGGFDDWLSEEPGKSTDPYAELSVDAAEDDADEMSDLPEGPNDSDGSSVESEPDEISVHSDDQEAPEVTPSIADDATPEDAEDDTGELPVLEPAAMEEDDTESAFSQTAPLIEFETFHGEDEADTGELEIVTEAPYGEVDSDEVESTLMYDGGVGSTSDENAAEEDSHDDDTSEVSVVAWFPEEGDEDETGDDDIDPFEDTGEAVFVTGETAAAAVTAASFGDLWDQDVEDDEESPIADAQPTEPQGDFGLDEDDLLLGATQEHIGLAAAIAAAENEDTEQVALVAEIPGLETSVVGFEDVVEAEGHRRVRARTSGDLIARIVTGVILVLALGASLIWRPALVAFAIAVFVLGAGEFYTALVRTERKPIALFGFIGIVGASLGAFFWSAAAIPIAFVLATILLLLFYAVVPGKSDPMGNLALTATVMVWAGLGSFAMLIAVSEDYQVLIIGVVVAVAAADIAAFFIGRSIGRTNFAPWVSPKKTVEGLVAGIVVAFGVGAMLHFFPPFELTSGLAIGAAAAFLTPIGDLAMSAAKRALGLKDMGSVLPGHGGFLDRIDGLLFVIPAAWAIFVWAGLL